MPRPWKHPKTGVYWFRKQVPAALRPSIGKIELKWSLSTKDRAEALTKFPAALEKAERLLSAAQGGFKLKAEQAAGMARRWLEAHLAEGDEELMRLLPGPLEEIDGETVETEQSAASLELSQMADILEDGRTGWWRKAEPWVKEAVDEAIRSEGLPIAEGGSDYQLLIEQFFPAAITLRQAMDRRAYGDYRPPEGLETLPTYKPVLTVRVPQKDDYRLSIALEAWKAEAVPTAQSEHEWRTVVKRFSALHRDKQVADISRDDVLSFRDNLLEQGKRPATARKHINALRSVLQVAVNRGKIATNPAANIKIADPVAPEDKRVGFTTSELETIFSSPVFENGERPQGGKGEAAYWLPILGLYTGARLTELAQLSVADIKNEEGIDYLDLTTRGEGKKLKTRGSRRKVPLHPDVVRLGFLRYVDERRAAGDQRVFPLLNAKRFGEPRPGASWSTWWGRYARQHGIERTNEKVFHSFRHTFKDACRVARIPEDVHDALTGHRSANVGRKYGQGEMPLKWLAEEIEKLRFPGASATHLSKRQLGRRHLTESAR